MPRRHTKDASIDRDLSKLTVQGGYTAIPGKRNSGTVYVNGDTNIDGIVDIQGDLLVNGVNFGNIGTTSLTLENGFNGAVLTSDDSGNGTWKTPHWKTNDNPTGITNPSDDIIYTTHDIGLGITTPEERLHISVTGTAQGAQVGSIKFGNSFSSATDADVTHKDFKGTSDGYGLKLESSGKTNLNSNTQIDFNILNTQVGLIDSSGNFGIGVTTADELLHVGGNVQIDGNLTVNGNTTTIDSTVIEVGDANLLMGTGNIADTIDGGFFAQYVESGTTKFAGLFRDASETDKCYRLFQGLEEKPGTTVNIAGVGYERAGLKLSSIDIESGITISQSDAILKHSGLTIIGNEPQIFLDVTGNMGLGVTTPLHKLDIEGDIRTSGVYKIGATDVLSSDTLGFGVTQSHLQQVGTLLNLTVTGNSTFNSDVEILGTLSVLGGITFNDSVNVSVSAPLLALAAGNTADILDTGFYAQYVETGTTKFAGLFRDASDAGIFKFFEGCTSAPDPNIDFSAGCALASLQASDFTAHGNINITGVYKFNGLDVLSKDTLGTGVTISNLETLGDLTSLNIIGDLTVNTDTLFVDASEDKVYINGITGTHSLEINGTRDLGVVTIESNDDADLTLKQAASRNIVLVDSTSAPLVTLTSSGNLGIGITNPTEALEVSGNGEITGNLVVEGDLTVNGTTTTINTETVTIEDPLIKLAHNNTADTIDTGIYSLYNDGTTKFAGSFRDASDGIVKFFDGLEVEPTTTVDLSATSFSYASLQMKDITLDEIKYTTESENLTFTNGGSTRAVLTPSGYLGVGTTALYPLHINRTNSSDWSGKFQNLTTEVFVANSSGNGMSINSGVANTDTGINLNVRNTTTNNVFVVRNDNKAGMLTSSPDRTFHVNVATAGDGGKFGNAFVGNWASTSTHAVFAQDDLSQTSGSYALKQDSSGETSLNAASGQEVHLNIADTTRVMTVTSAGNVGIGITNPTDKFEVSGNSTLTATSADALTLENTLTTINMANADGSGILTNATTTSNYGLSIRESGTALFQVNNDGTVGIGVTAPNAELEVLDTIRVSNVTNDTIDIQADTNNLRIDANDLLSIGVNDNNVMNFTVTDRVAIGTTLAQQKFHVEGTQYISTSLGIGITTQTEAFHVVGDGKVTGDFTIGGNLIFDGVAVEGLAIQDPLIKLGSGNTADLVDSGLYSLYIDAGTTKFSGLFRDASDSGKYNLFQELEVEPGTTVDKTATGFDHATLILDTLEYNTNIIGPLATIGTILAGEIGVTTLGVTGDATITGTLDVIGGIAFSGDLTVDGVDQTFHVDASTNNVGVGTTAPTETFHVVGDVLLDGDIEITDSLIKLAHTNSADTSDIGFYGQYDDGTAKYAGLFRDATDDKFRLFNSLTVAPGTSTVDIGGAGYSNTTLVVDVLEADTEVIAPEFTATCDMRVKENIVDMDTRESLNKINNLELFTYNYIKEFNRSDATLYGLVAQQVETVMPEAIKIKSMRFGNETIDDFKTISQNTLIANLIGAVQILSKRIEQLEKQN